MIYSYYNYFGVIHSDTEIGIILLREPVPVLACISVLCVGSCQQWTQTSPALGVGVRIWLLA